MKMKPSSRLIFALIGLASLVSASNGFAYDIADYFPLEQGFTWTYRETVNGSTSEETQTIDGFEDVGGMTTTKLVHDEGHYECLAFDSEAVKLYKVADPGLFYVIYQPPYGQIPAEADIGGSVNYFSYYTVYDEAHTPVGSGTMAMVVRLDGVEDVSVPAGNFAGCLNFYYRNIQVESSGERSVNEGRFYLAPDVGMVKKNYTFTEYDEHDNIVDVFSEEDVLLSYTPSGGNGGEPHSQPWIPLLLLD